MQLVLEYNKMGIDMVPTSSNFLQWIPLIPCKVVGIMESAYGKFPQLESNENNPQQSTFLIMELKHFLTSISDYLHANQFHDGFKTYLKSV